MKEMNRELHISALVDDTTIYGNQNAYPSSSNAALGFRASISTWLGELIHRRGLEIQSELKLHKRRHLSAPTCCHPSYNIYQRTSLIRESLGLRTLPTHRWWI